MNSSAPAHSRFLYLRVAVATVLLIPAIWFSLQTINGLTARRSLREDLAEITHARYGILSADKWRGIIRPILEAQVSNIDLKNQSKDLRPMVEHSLNALLDNIKTQMTAPPAKGAAGLPGGGNAFIVNMIINSLRPHVPEYTNVVMAELTKQSTQKTFRESIRGVLDEAVKNTFSHTDMTRYNAILNRYGCADSAECESVLDKKIADADAEANRDYLIVLGCAALAFALLIVGKTFSRAAVVLLMAFCITMLVGGVLSPMLEVEVRVTKLDATLLGAPIEFSDQSLYYRSKTVLEVFQTLIQMHRPEMTLVGVLVILFSVVFPALKMLALSASLFQPALLRTNRLVRLLAFELSKWSMADVMVLAIFMSFVAFNGIIGSGLGDIRGVPNVHQVLLPTNASKILPGYYLFIGFCLGSILLSRKLERGIGSQGGDAID